MSATYFISPLVGLLPVIAFLAVLVYFDSYKLVKLRVVVATIVGGGIVAGVSYFLNGALIEVLNIEPATLSGYVAPLAEELLKALIVFALIQRRRIGFLIDAAIFGFAVGAGFAVVENSYYFLARLSADVGVGTWIIRGFGTAIMHGGTTAIFGMMSLRRIEQRDAGIGLALVPGLSLAVLIHAAYNHSLLPPIYTTLVVMFALPVLLHIVFQRNEKSIGDWLGTGFDADAQMLELINSGQLSDSPLGKYLSTLKAKFQGVVVADILCYVRLHTELAMRAKGMLMMRENGFDVPIDEATKDSFEELHYLEKSIGKTGQLAIAPMLHLSHKDLWQLYILAK